MFRRRSITYFWQLNRSRALQVALILIWLASAIGGIAWLTVEAAETGERHTVPSTWPDDVVAMRPHREATLLVFLHPRCPCSLATLAELERLLPLAKKPIDTWLIYGIPSTADAGWRETSTWKRGEGIANTQQVFDPGGQLAQQFGVATSGDCLLYHADGNLAFQGGITPSRAHEGNCLGQADLLLALNENARNVRDLPVYGCPLVIEAKLDRPRCCSSGDEE